MEAPLSFIAPIAGWPALATWFVRVIAIWYGAAIRASDSRFRRSAFSAAAFRFLGFLANAGAAVTTKMHKTKRERITEKQSERWRI